MLRGLDAAVKRTHAWGIGRVAQTATRGVKWKHLIFEGQGRVMLQPHVPPLMLPKSKMKRAGG
jgi:hypothetical protein